MAVTKNPLIRYRILDRCFSNSGKKYYIEDLIEECRKVLQEINPLTKGISRRQILDDINFMESSEGWNINLARYRTGKRVYYRYNDVSYSINNFPFGNLNILELQKAVEILSSINGISLVERLQSISPHIDSKFNQILTQGNLISFDDNPYLVGREKMEELYQSIVDKHVLAVTYNDFKSNSPYVFTFHPYHLKQYNNRWFVFGLNPVVNKSDWNLAVDRIISISRIDDCFVPNEEINWKEYFEDIVGVTKYDDANIEKITLTFFGETCKYVVTKPLHGSQKSKWINDNELEIRLELIINTELERIILSYGSNVRVDFPESLSKKIKQTISDALENYHY
ncbi:WYL domain-containing protein [Pedobacter sp. B4-66]|uniref:helix-turn-helix transcriptional regulator n=1 Tax=Pedobacter sp. B4-66 TaxID=2817280 RepID=UPI001BDAB0FA|nr:WYL domain-containing protein [Pedobacter sp. B4-66]